MIAALACIVLGAQGLELRGVVTEPAGRPVAGANVFVATARPRQGVGGV
jgi:hypothetical protein